MLLLFYFIQIEKNLFFLPSGDQNLERRNVEQPVFRNFEIANVKTKKMSH